MLNAVNKTNDAATSPVVEETRTEHLDSVDFILDGLAESDTPDTIQPTLEEEVEETTEEEIDTDSNEDDDLEEFEEDLEEFEEEDEVDDTIIDELETEDDDTEEVLDEDTDEETEDEWFYVGHKSEYRTAEAAIKGIEAKDSYITELETGSNELTEEVIGLKQKLSMYTQTVSEEAIQAAAIQSLLPPEYQGKTDDDFEDDVELRKFWKAELAAKETFSAKQAQAAQAAKDEETARAAKVKNAAKYIRETGTTEFFGVRNPEERNTLKKSLTEKDDAGYTAIDKARMIVEVFGEEDGLKYLEGLRLQIQGEESEPVSSKPKSKQKGPTKVKKRRVPPKEVVEKVKKTKVRKKAQITPPSKATPKDIYKDKTEVDIIADGLR